MTEDPRLDPLEEEALRRVRSRVVQAVRDEQRGARSGRRPVVAVAFGLALLVVAGVVFATLHDRGGRPSRVDVLDDGGRGEPSSLATTTAVVRSTTTTTEPLPPRGTRPSTFVGITHDGRLVVVDVATGQELRELARLGDPGAEPPAEGPGPNVVASVAVDSVNGVVYYEECCEPVTGVVWAVPLAGGEPVRVDDAAWPAVSGDGARVARVVLSTVSVTSREGGTWLHPAAAGEEVAAVNPALSVDGTSLAFERHHTSFDDPGEIVVAVTDDPARPPLVWSDPLRVGWLHPTYRRDGDLVVVQQSWADQVSGTGPRAARVVDPATGTVTGSFLYPAPVREQDYDATGTWLLVTLNDGQVVWYGGGTSAVVAAGYLAASW